MKVHAKGQSLKGSKPDSCLLRASAPSRDNRASAPVRRAEMPVADFRGFRSGQFSFREGVAKIVDRELIQRHLHETRASGISTGLNLRDFVEILPQANVGIRPNAKKPLLSLDFLRPLPILVSKQREFLIRFPRLCIGSRRHCFKSFQVWSQ